MLLLGMSCHNSRPWSRRDQYDISRNRNAWGCCVAVLRPCRYPDRVSPRAAELVLGFGGFPSSRAISHSRVSVLGFRGIAVLLGHLQLLVEAGKAGASHPVRVGARRLVLAGWLLVFIGGRDSLGYKPPEMVSTSDVSNGQNMKMTYQSFGFKSASC